MDTLRHIKPATLEQAFDLRPINDVLIEKLPGDNKYIPTPGKEKIYLNFLQSQNEYVHKPFIEANTQEIYLKDLKK
ncbi:MAG: hypothetical protein RSD42_00715 [Oscillospiraceae bacterium]